MEGSNRKGATKYHSCPVLIRNASKLVLSIATKHKTSLVVSKDVISLQHIECFLMDVNLIVNLRCVLVLVNY